MAGAARRDRHRGEVQHVVEDREIMDREVPDHVHVALEQAEIHPGRVVVEHFAQGAVGDQLVDLLDRARVDEGVIDHEGQVALGRLLDQQPRLEGRGRDRLLDEDVLAGPERVDRDLEMRAHRGRHHDGVDLRIRDEVAPILVELGGGIALARPGEGRGRLVGDGGEPALLGLRRAAGEIRPPIAVADDSDGDHVRGSPQAICRDLAAEGRRERARFWRVSPMTRAGQPATMA